MKFRESASAGRRRAGRALARVGAGVLMAAAMAACGDREAGEQYLEQLSEGITRDSLFAVLGQGPLTASGADSVRVDRGWRVSRFLIDGTVYEVVYVRDEAGDVSEPLAKAKESPVVLDGGKVRGWGWEWYVETGRPQYRLPSPPSDSATTAGAKS